VLRVDWRVVGSNPNDLIPLLFPADFSDTTLSAVRLLPSSSESPYVGLGWDHPQFFELAPKSIDFETHRARALANLRAREERAEWGSEELPGTDGTSRCLLRVGDETTASDLLDFEVLRAGMKELDAEEVFIAVPTRVAMVMSADRLLAAHLCVARIEHFCEDEFVIGPQIYRFDGETLSLDGLVARPEDAEPIAKVRRLNRRSARRALSEPTTALGFDTEVDEPADESLGYVPRGLWVETKGGEVSMLLALSEPDLPSASKKIDLLLKRRLERYLARPRFGGVIRFQLDPELIEPTADNTDELQQLLRKKTRKLERKGFATSAGEPVLLVGSIGGPDRAQAGPRRAEAKARAKAKVAEPRPQLTPVQSEALARLEQAFGSAVPPAPEARAKHEATREAETPETLRQARLCGFIGKVGAFVATLAVFVRFGAAVRLQGQGIWLERPVLAPLGCLILLVFMLRGSAYGRFGLLGLSVTGCIASLLGSRTYQGPMPVFSVVDHVVALVFGLAALCLAVGLGVGASGRPASEPPYRGVLGLLLGALLLFATGRDTRACVTRMTVLGAPRACRDLPKDYCGTVPGCRVIPPSAVPGCPPGLCAPAECEGTPERACHEHSSSTCPVGLCERRGL
jgi:hypothetical protein